MDLFTRPWEGCLEGGEAQVATLRCIWPLFSNLINAAIILSSIVALYFIIISGIRFVTSQGDPEAISSAKKTLTFAIIGLIFILLSFAFFNGFFEILGVNQNVVGGNPDGGIIIDPGF